MRAMKDSGVEWLGEIPANWDIKRVGSLFRERKQQVSANDYTALSVTKQGVVPQLDTAAKSDATETRKLIKEGDFVINSRSDRKGSSGLAPIDGSCSSIYIVLEPTGLDGRFAHQLFRSQAFQEEFYRWGTGIVDDLWSTRYSSMKMISLPVPPKGEVDSIASYLDKETSQIDLLISKKEQLIEKLLERRQALITQAVTKGLDPTVPMKDSGVEWLGQVPDSWEVIPLKRLVKLNTETLNESNDPSEEIHYVEIGNVSLAAGIEGWATMRYGDSPSRARRVVREGDVLISTVRTYLKAIGRVVSIPTDGRLVASTGFAALRPVGVDSRFLELAIASDSFIGKIQANSVGVSYPGIDASKLISFKIALPPTAQQNVISNYLDAELGQISELINSSKSAIELLRERRQALITQVVTGKLDVRGFAGGNS